MSDRQPQGVELFPKLPLIAGTGARLAPVGAGYIGVDTTGALVMSVDGGAYAAVGGGGGLGFQLTWGAAFSDLDVGQYAVPNGRADSGQTAGLGERSEYTCLVNGTITAFSYQTQSGDTSTVWKIVVDGVVQATITQTAAVGTQVVSVAVTFGQLIAIEMDASDVDPNRCLLSVLIE